MPDLDSVPIPEGHRVLTFHVVVPLKPTLEQMPALLELCAVAALRALTTSTDPSPAG